MIRPFLLALAAVLGLPGVAQAASVAVEDRACGSEGCIRTATLRAAPGEVNSITVAKIDVDTFELEDAAVDLTAGSGCSVAGPRRVRCTARLAEIRAGDGDDVVVARAGATLDGGPGDDTLRAEMTAPFEGVLMFGGGGRDTLVGSGGSDSFVDGDDPAAPDSDVVVGGDGLDMVGYTARRRSLHLDLRNPEGHGERGENDRISEVEGVVGGGGDDRIVASWVVAGNNGDDVLVGGGGSNFMYGGAGADRMLGRGGADQVLPADDFPMVTGVAGEGPPQPAREPDGRDVVDCGGERDSVHGIRGDYVQACEQLYFAGTLLQPLESLLPLRRATSSIARVRGHSSARRRLVMSVRDLRTRRVVGRASMPPGRSAEDRRLLLRLDRRGRALLRQRGRLRVRVQIEDGPPRRPSRSHYETLLRLARR